MAEFKLYKQSVALSDMPSALEEWLLADEQILIRLSAVLTLARPATQRTMGLSLYY